MNIDYKFKNEFFSDLPDLDDVIEFIRKNLEPNDIFDKDVLENWARLQGMEYKE